MALRWAENRNAVEVISLEEGDEEKTISWHEDKEPPTPVKELEEWGLTLTVVEIYAMAQELTTLREENALLRREIEGMRGSPTSGSGEEWDRGKKRGHKRVNK